MTKRLKQSLAVILCLVSIEINAQFLALGDDPNVIVFYEHEEFSWGINKEKVTRIGRRNREYTVDSLYCYITLKSDLVDSSNAIFLERSYHSLYSSFENVFPVNYYTTLCIKEELNDQNLNDIISNMSYHIEILDRPVGRIYKLRQQDAFSIYLDPEQVNREIAQKIAMDILSFKDEQGLIDNDSHTLPGITLEAVALGIPPTKEQRNFSNQDEIIHIADAGEVRSGDIFKYDPNIGVEDYGYIKEGQFLSSYQISNLEHTYFDKLRRTDFSSYLNDDGKSLLDLYQYIDGLECRTNIDSAAINCPSIDYIYLLNPELSGVPESVGQLSNLQGISGKNVSIGRIPDDICSLPHLNSINFINVDKVELPPCLKDMEILRFVTLSHANLSEIPPVLLELKDLWDLNLKGNPITKLPEELATMSSLRSIIVDYNPGLKIPKNLLSKKDFSLELVVNNEIDMKQAEKLLIKLGVMPENDKDRDKFYEKDLPIWLVREASDFDYALQDSIEDINNRRLAAVQAVSKELGTKIETLLKNFKSSTKEEFLAAFIPYETFHQLASEENSFNNKEMRKRLSSISKSDFESGMRDKMYQDLLQYGKDRIDWSQIKVLYFDFSGTSGEEDKPVKQFQGDLVFETEEAKDQVKTRWWSYQGNYYLLSIGSPYSNY